MFYCITSILEALEYFCLKSERKLLTDHLKNCKAPLVENKDKRNDIIKKHRKERKR